MSKKGNSQSKYKVPSEYDTEEMNDCLIKFLVIIRLFRDIHCFVQRRLEALWQVNDLPPCCFPDNQSV